MYPENPDRTDAAEEPVFAVFQGIAQLWGELLGRQQGPEQNMAVEQQLHAPQRSSSSPAGGISPSQRPWEQLRGSGVLAMEAEDSVLADLDFDALR
jgi:hypothetical protein